MMHEQRSFYYVTYALLILIGLSFFFLNEILTGKDGNVMGITVESAAFKEGGMIPGKYTCDGADISPALSWSGLPGTTQSIALISDDPDAPMGTWVHWVLYDLPLDTTNLPEDLPTKKTLESGGKQGTNDFGKIGYGGPCPPGGTHRYFFKIYALDKELNIESGATKAQLLKQMKGHILAEGQLMGNYSRGR